MMLTDGTYRSGERVMVFTCPGCQYEHRMDVFIFRLCPGAVVYANCEGCNQTVKVSIREVVA